jgi:hypothetical protein
MTRGGKNESDVNKGRVGWEARPARLDDIIVAGSGGGDRK